MTAKPSKSSTLFKFHPLDDRVLVERDEAFKKTSGGLFIPDTAADTPNQGTVVSVGPGHIGKKGILRPTDVKPGQKIIFNKYSGNELKLANKDYVILRETDIIGIVEE
ncbi:MAG: co-chaperone GroES [Proteobacteria bacterium SG_bin7]|nr:MAG: co-chaperone GroES [Proteobacteria bacterium SG_bin7]